ncbi:MAG: hypothetical protein GEU78_16095 [Actinobacteria bacterium]|nr:hypothetical protein [Actinomycetota bacterium]
MGGVISLGVGFGLGYGIFRNLPPMPEPMLQAVVVGIGAALLWAYFGGRHRANSQWQFQIQQQQQEQAQDQKQAQTQALHVHVADGGVSAERRAAAAMSSSDPLSLPLGDSMDASRTAVEHVAVEGGSGSSPSILCGDGSYFTGGLSREAVELFSASGRDAKIALDGLDDVGAEGHSHLFSEGFQKVVTLPGLKAVLYGAHRLADSMETDCGVGDVAPPRGGAVGVGDSVSAVADLVHEHSTRVEESDCDHGLDHVLPIGSTLAHEVEPLRSLIDRCAHPVAADASGRVRDLEGQSAQAGSVDPDDPVIEHRYRNNLVFLSNLIRHVPVLSSSKHPRDASVTTEPAKRGPLSGPESP